MKKITLLLLGLVAMTGMVSCNNEDPEQIVQFQQEFYIRSVNNDDNSVKFSKSMSLVNADFTSGEMDLTISVKLDDTHSATVQIKRLVLNYDAMSGLFTISKGATTTVEGGAVVGFFTGTLDNNTNIMYVNFEADGKYNVACTTRLLYPYGVMNSTYEKNGTKKTCKDNDFALAIELNEDGTKAKFTLYNVLLEDEQDMVIYIDYASAAVTPKIDGYYIEAATLEATIDNIAKKDYDITDFKATLTGHGRYIEGSFTIGGHEVTFKAKMLNDSTVL